jgi:DNA-directed RNA polymerase specialized sigma24 family protein
MTARAARHHRVAPIVVRAETGSVENLGAWLTTVVARVCLNMLRSRGHRREEPLDPHVPDPEHEELLADSVGLALMVVPALTPAERPAFVLHDMFAVPFDEIAPMVDRSQAAARQLASRARRRVQGQAPAPDPDPARPGWPRRPSDLDAIGPASHSATSLQPRCDRY